MKQSRISTATITAFAKYLREQEKSPATIEKYTFCALALVYHLDGNPLTKDRAVSYKEHLSKSYKATSINTSIAALNSFFAFLRLPLKLKPLKIQRQPFQRSDRELTHNDYHKLISTAETTGDRMLALVIRTIHETGIRVSELQYITVEAAQNGEAQINLKGKIRQIFLTSKTTKPLLRFAKERGITEGSIFLSPRSKKPLDRHTIWRGMKRVAKIAGIMLSKVFPHNLRKLFARRFYQKTKNLTELADLLGHSDINTTRIYTATTSAQYRERLERLAL